ncbi:sensor histidine kinase [Flindersiella endophytica]
MSELPLAIVRFVVLIVLFFIGIGLFLIALGWPVLAACMYTARGFADVDRGRLSTVQGWRATRPAYRSAKERRGIRKLFVPIGQGQSWADWGHGVLGIFPAIFAFAITIAWWAVTVAGLTAFAYQWAIHKYDKDATGLAELLGYGNTAFAEALLNTIIGLIFLVTLPAVVRGTAALNASLARSLLTSDRVAELEFRVSELTESRDAAVSAEADALRRIERDIHDGPQQRLVRLAMDLSAAQRKIERDPEAVKRLLGDAVRQTRETLDELRALSRGIAPPILADRGLRAALAAVAGRCTVPTELSIDLTDGERLPAAVENAAYFVVAEALTNVAKHSGASNCRVEVYRAESSEPSMATLRVIVADNGLGGAHNSKGHGLAGLTDRVRGIGGHLDVESPHGGPTLLTAELPCAS